MSLASTEAGTVASELYGRIRSCTRCLLAKSRTHSVPGEGPLDAEVMFIGEAPGMNEDREGRPFVGAAGKFLTELIGAAGWQRDAVYITNVLKCRPPGNRDPLPNEIEACNGYIEEQLRLIDPLLLVSLGRYSMARYFPNARISKVHGQHREIEGRLFVPMYHPAAALHQGSLRQTIIEDFKKLPALLEQARALRQPVGGEPDERSPAEQMRLFD